MANYRELTAKEKKVAATAKRLFEDRKASLNLNQTSAGKQLGMAQATFGQYLNGVIPCNTDFILKLAALLNVGPEKIDPNVNYTLTRAMAGSIPLKRIPLLGTTSGERIIGTIDLQFINEADKKQDFYGVMVDAAAYAPSYTLHSVAVAAPSGFLKPNDHVIVKRKDSLKYEIKYLITIDAESVAIGDLTTSKKEIIPLDELDNLHKIAHVKMA